MNKFNKGDKVKVRITSKGIPRIRGRIMSCVAYVNNAPHYSVQILNKIIRVPEVYLVLDSSYNGNEVVSWADLRHIWRP